jgi:hypothetical protein
MNVARALGASITKQRCFVALFALLGVLPGGCVYDSSNRCGPHQVLYGDANRCVCDSNSVTTATGCTACGEHEVPSPGGCTCEAGYAKPSADEACAPVPMGLGSPCSPSMPCTDPTFDHCATGLDGSGYCTQTGCAANEDCAAGYACDTSGSPSYCQRPPVGAGTPCTSDADCAGTEATYCDTFVQHACLVQGCSVSPNNCFSGTECCDLSSLGIPQPICIPAGACMQ